MSTFIFENDDYKSCHCIGPQNGQPYCPCEMKAKKVFERNGRWIEPEKDLGPVRKTITDYQNIRARRDNMAKVGDLDYEI